VLHKLAGIFQSPAALQRVETLEKAAEWALTATIDQRPKRFFCPIWHDQTPDKIHWWMTFNQRTYSSDLLAHLGGKNIFHGRDRRFPLEADLGISSPQPTGERDTRYPRVCLEDIREADPEVILLPDEPYKFDEVHHAFLVEQLSKTQAVCNQMIYLIDGSLITWHGTRLAKALNELPAVFI
jgi:ABC-type Fe3+-hydroxamate transport system substrate-binding protein